MIILGINGINDLFHDAGATLIKDNVIIASVEEERFNRQKHSNGIPYNAISFCLSRAGITFDQIDHIGYYLDPKVLQQTFVDDVVEKYGCSAERLKYYTSAANNIAVIEETLRQKYQFGSKTQFHYINHHLAHASSAYFTSGFDESAVLTIDGSGDRESSTLYYGNQNSLTKIQDFLVYPESIGFIYTVFAAHLGLGWIEGPGKVMGLAGYGKPDLSLFTDIVRLQDSKSQPISIDLSFFDYHIGGNGFTSKGKDKFGAPRQPSEPLQQKHFDLAASVQAMLERSVLHLVSLIPHLVPQTKNLCFAGGVALNVCTNRIILDSNLFDQFYVVPPASDAGTSLGCALYLDSQHTSNHRYNFNVYCGPHITEDYPIEPVLKKHSQEIDWQELTEEEICQKAADYIRDNKIIGWAQGRMECGPRALGNRSMLTNAMNPKAKDELNTRVKKRESFRPYASSVLAEECGKWFDIDSSRYMLLEAKVLLEKQSIVPGIVHVDGTSRPQSVSSVDNPRYYKLIKKFYEMTGVPMVLNTSLNMHGEPIVNTPDEAVKDLLDTDLDALFLGNYLITRKPKTSIWQSLSSRLSTKSQQLFKASAESSITTWDVYIKELRRKWREVPGGDEGRVDTSELSKMSDQSLLERWLSSREKATTGEFFQVRGWYHLLYKDIFRGKKIMDVGSGFGIDGITFAQHGAEVTFVDIVESNLEILRRLCELLQIPNVQFCYLESLESLSKLADDYDVIWCQGSLINAPFELVKQEVQVLLKHLKLGGRWVELAYPKIRWEREGKLPFERWGERTDGIGTPWVEWYDLPKLQACLAPAQFDVVMYFEFHNSDFNWFDLVRRG